MAPEKTPSTIDEYIALADPEARAVLNKVRKIIRACAPDAEECMSYKMPAFRQGRVFIYFAAFKQHLGIYPPVTKDARLIAELAEYRNEKGNLRFVFKKPLPYDLIGKVAKALYGQYAG